MPGGNDDIKKLYDVVSSEGLYTKSFDEFQQKYSTPESIDKLYNVVSSEGLYTKDKNSFYQKYYPNLLNGKSGGSIPTISLSKNDIDNARNPMPYNPSINEDFTTQYPADKKNSLLPFINEKPLSQGQQMEKLSLPYLPGSPEYYQRKEEEKKAEEQKKDEAANNSLNLYFKNNQAELKGFDIESTDKKNDLLKQNRSDKFSIEAAKKLSPFIKKKAELLNALENGELQISQNDLGQPYLSRPVNSNLKNAWSAVTDAFTGSKEADKILALKDGDELEKYVNEKNANQKYLPEETDKSSLAYQASSGGLLALKGVVGAAAGTLVAAAAPETGGISLEGLAPIGAWLLTVPDMSKQAKANALISYYERAKQENPNLSNADAYNMAQHASDAVYAETMLTGTALNAMATHSLPPNFGQGFFKATGQFLKNQPANVAEAGGYSAGASMLKDIAVKEAGYKLNHDEAWNNATHSFSDMAKMQLVFNGAFGLFKLPLYTKAQAKADLVKLPPETINQLAENAIKTGQATPEEIQKGLQGLSNYKAAMQKIAETGNKEKDAALAGLVEQKINLENEHTPKIENADPLFKDEIQKEYDAKVNAINEKMAAIKKSDNLFEHETDNLTGQKATEKIYEPKQFGREESTDNVTIIRPTVEPSENIEVQMPSQVSKPNIIENEKIEETEIPNKQAVGGSESGNEPLTSTESSITEKGIGETVQPQQESITPSTGLSRGDVEVDEKVVKSRVKRIAKSLNVDEQRSQQIHDIALKAKDYEDFKKQVSELIGDDTVNENRIAEQYDDIRNEAKSEYEKELERNLEDLRAAYTDATKSDAALRKMSESPKSVRGFIKRLLTGATPESVAANKARLVEMQRKYRKEKANMRAMLPRERGANFVVEKLSKAARNGDISQEAADLAIDLIRKQPDMFGDLAISITGKKGENDGVQGWYRAADALVKIFKNPSDETTVAHEVLHHTERFLPHEIRDKIIAEWNNEVNLQIADIQKKLKTETNTDTRQQLTQGLLYLGLAQERQVEPNHANVEAMERIMSKYLGDHTDSQGNFHKGLGNSWYQLYNPSEWWAVNASRLFREAKNKPELKTWTDKAKAFYNYLIDAVKRIFKGSPTAAVEKGLKAVLNGETLEDREGNQLSASKKLLNIKQKGSFEDKLKSIYDEVNKSKPKDPSLSPNIEPKPEQSGKVTEQTEISPEITSLQKEKEELIKERESVPTRKVILHDEETGKPTNRTKEVPLEGESLEKYKREFDEKIAAIDKKIEAKISESYEKEKYKLEEDYKTKVEKAKAQTVELERIEAPETDAEMQKVAERLEKKPIKIKEGEKEFLIDTLAKVKRAENRIFNQLNELKKLINCT